MEFSVNKRSITIPMSLEDSFKERVTMCIILILLLGVFIFGFLALRSCIKVYVNQEIKQEQVKDKPVEW